LGHRLVFAEIAETNLPLIGNPGYSDFGSALVLDPIFEADLPPEQYAYRRGHSALDAVRRVFKLINTGHREIVDADLASYFGAPG
jgi:hypothetical protein